jgi:hypothetical protein
MDLLVLLFLIALIGLGVWALTKFIPMPAPFQTLIVVVAVIGVLILLWNVFGGYAPHIRVGK